MTDNARKAFEFIKNNNEAMERFRAVKTIDEVMSLAKEYGFNLTEEDLNITQEKREILEGKKKLDISELEKVSGAGDVCACPIAGGGGGDLECGCFLGGMGTVQSGENANKVVCACAIGGGGNKDFEENC